MPFKVLVVDDSSFMRTLLKEILQKGGYQLAGEAANGREAVEQFGRLRPDLVTMDIVMPELDGIEAVKAIRAADPGARIVMVSAMGQQGLVIDAIQAGARDFIIKPFQTARVLEAFKRVLG